MSLQREAILIISNIHICCWSLNPVYGQHCMRLSKDAWLTYEVGAIIIPISQVREVVTGKPNDRETLES